MKHTITTLANLAAGLLIVLGSAACGSETPTTPTPTAELTVSLDPGEVFIGPGGSATINLKIIEAENLVSWRAVLLYDPAKLNVSTLKIRELNNNILAQGGASIIESDKVIDADNGRIVVGALAQRQGFAGEDGDGVLAQFKISSPTADPSSEIRIESIELYTYPVASPPVAVTPKTVNAAIKKGS